MKNIVDYINNLRMPVMITDRRKRLPTKTLPFHRIGISESSVPFRRSKLKRGYRNMTSFASPRMQGYTPLSMPLKERRPLPFIPTNSAAGIFRLLFEVGRFSEQASLKICLYHAYFMKRKGRSFSMTETKPK